MKTTERNIRIKRLRSQMAEQRAWMDSRGGNLAGYVLFYDPSIDANTGIDPEAIYNADLVVLNGLVHALKALGAEV